MLFRQLSQLMQAHFLILLHIITSMHCVLRRQKKTILILTFDRKMMSFYVGWPKFSNKCGHWKKRSY